MHFSWGCTEVTEHDLTIQLSHGNNFRTSMVEGGRGKPSDFANILEKLSGFKEQYG